MKEAILVVSFGTGFPEAKQNSLDRITTDIVTAFPEIKVFEAFSSSIILKKLARENRPMQSVREAMDSIRQEGFLAVTVLPTHMIPGIEYQKIRDILLEYKDDFSKITLLPTVLQEEVDCRKIAELTTKILQIPKTDKCENGCYKEYVLMGHGTEDAANVRYIQMNEAFAALGFEHVRIASVEAKPDLADAVAAIEKRIALNQKAQTLVALHPFMVVAGDHANNDMAGNEDSFKTQLEALGYGTQPIIKGLGEYDKFRQIYVDKLKEYFEKSLPDQ